MAHLCTKHEFDTLDGRNAIACTRRRGLRFVLLKFDRLPVRLQRRRCRTLTAVIRFGRAFESLALLLQVKRSSRCFPRFHNGSYVSNGSTCTTDCLNVAENAHRRSGAMTPRAVEPRWAIGRTFTFMTRPLMCPVAVLMASWGFVHAHFRIGRNAWKPFFLGTFVLKILPVFPYAAASFFPLHTCSFISSFTHPQSQSTCYSHSHVTFE